MATPLFHETPRLTFPKTKTASIQLSENHAKWSQEILNQLFKEVPAASEYTPNITTIQADEEQGYAIGIITIKSAPDTSLNVSGDVEGAGVRQAVVPFFVKNFMLLPLDVLIFERGRMTPLTDERLREALFKPQTFSLMTKDWGDQSIYSMFAAPGENSDGGNGVGDVTYLQGPGMKFAMLDTIGPSLSDSDLEKVAAVLVNEPGVMEQLKTNPVFGRAMRKVSSYEGGLMSGDETMKAAMEAAPIHVAQLGYSEVEGKYWYKTASRTFYYRTAPEYLTRREMIEKVGSEITTKIDTDGAVTVADGTIPEPFSEDKAAWEAVTKAGIYRVLSRQGKEYVGWVIPGLIDMTGTSLPMTVFTNGAVASVQDEVLGLHVSMGVNLPDDEPTGTGVFYIDAGSHPQATVPVVITGSESGMDGSTIYHVKTLTGGDYALKLVPGLKKMLPPTEGSDVVMIPGSARFIALNDEAAVSLVNGENKPQKTASELAAPTVTLFGDGEDYVLRFRNAPKLAHAVPEHASEDDTVFALCLAGYDPQTAYALTKKASRSLIEVPVDDIRTMRDVIEPSVEGAKVAAESCEKLRKNLIKEASALPDIQTVDSVLSLGFINPENVRTFVSRLPYLEKSLSHLCEMILAARMGLSEIPEFASARAARGMDDTIQGLKSLAMRDLGEGA